MSINLKTILKLQQEAEYHGIRYGLGAKAKASTPISKISAIDCSGWVRYLMLNAGLSKFPDGSQNQRAWAEAGGDGLIKKQVRYADLMLEDVKADPNRLFICFIRPGHNGCGNVGHVWLAYMGETIESCGSRGVCQRSLNQGSLKRMVYSAYELVVE